MMIYIMILQINIMTDLTNILNLVRHFMVIFVKIWP